VNDLEKSQKKNGQKKRDLQWQEKLLLENTNAKYAVKYFLQWRLMTSTIARGMSKQVNKCLPRSNLLRGKLSLFSSRSSLEPHFI
jgi:hypothetical protein